MLWNIFDKYDQILFMLKRGKYFLQSSLHVINLELWLTQTKKQVTKWIYLIVFNSVIIFVNNISVESKNKDL